MVRLYAITLYDKQDGHAADWPLVAQLLFKAAFGCIDEAKGDERARSVLRRVEAGLYDRLAGNGDDGLLMPLTAPVQHGVEGRAPKLPEPRNRP